MKRARTAGRGSVFTPSDFLDIAVRSNVDQALSRLIKTGKLRRLARGLLPWVERLDSGTSRVIKPWSFAMVANSFSPGSPSSEANVRSARMRMTNDLPGCITVWMNA